MHKSKMFITPKGEAFREDDGHLYQIIAKDKEVRIMDSKKFKEKHIDDKTKKFWEDLDAQINTLIEKAPAADSSQQEKEAYKAEVKKTFQDAGLTNEQWKGTHGHAFLDKLAAKTSENSTDVETSRRASEMFQSVNTSFGGVSHVGNKAPFGGNVIETRVVLWPDTTPAEIARMEIVGGFKIQGPNGQLRTRFDETGSQRWTTDFKKEEGLISQADLQSGHRFNVGMAGAVDITEHTKALSDSGIKNAPTTSQNTNNGRDGAVNAPKVADSALVAEKAKPAPSGQGVA